MFLMPLVTFLGLVLKKPRGMFTQDFALQGSSELVCERLIAAQIAVVKQGGLYGQILISQTDTLTHVAHSRECRETGIPQVVHDSLMHGLNVRRDLPVVQ